MNRCIPFLVLLLSLVGTAWGQQVPGGFGNTGFGATQPMSTTNTSPSGIDDSTKVIYGPTTTRYILEDDVLNNRRTLYPVDTTMDEVHRFLYVQRSHNLYQDLGALGTPMHPVFVNVPDQLGAQTGYTVFDAYAYQPLSVKYYNTKSPFTDMYVALGGRNQNILRFDFAQNITPRWNVGFAVQRFTSQKQYGVAGTNDPNKLLAQNWSGVIHTNYRSKNEKYTLLANFINMNHSLDEQGGVLSGTSVTGETIIYNYTGNSRLTGNSVGNGYFTSPNSSEIRNDYHIYQQFAPAEGIQLFHRLDYKRHKNFYQDTTLAVNAGFYKEILGTAANLGDTSKIVLDARFRLLENQVGLKGIFERNGSAFNYRAYLRNRIYGQYTQYATGYAQSNEYETRRFETFLGGWLGYYFPDSLSQITAEAEYQVGGGYRLQGQLTSRLLTAGYSSIFVQPTLLQERFQSNIINWRREGFNLRGYNHAFGKLNLRYRKLQIEPGVNYYLLTNYVYFDQQAIAQQASGSFSVLQTGLGYRLAAGKFLASGQAYYTLQSTRSYLQTPPFFMNARFQYEVLYAKALYIQVGVDLHYKSPYYANAYMPITQQFYLQNSQQVEGYILADLYANLRVNRTRLFVKLTHANQGVLQPGYFVAPNYLQMRRGFAFGVDWYLFD
ncbi:putative beta-barrel porin [Spirosoma oryzae]|uniref:Putative beta-barrel porin n=1 Tax=Spirosoma oryzae TaxID=1469603 RepID=A0A2T0SQ00_9BACT|nr:putative porin [Spirosoma oryzae]PRY35489.1 putative beta-barrel porin [Spirosoma oryzae]